MRRIAVALVTILLSVSICHAFEEPDNFRGIKWGSSPREARAIIHDQWRARGLLIAYATWSEYLKFGIKPIEPENGLYGPKRDQGTGEFLFSDKIGDATADIHLWFVENKFVQAELTFLPGFFAILETAFTEKYGAPTLQEENEVQNRLGAKFVNKTLSWNGPNIRIRLQKYGTNLTKGRAVIGKADYEDARVREFQQKSRDAAKDL
jgi:hypothetical protein